MQLVQTQHHCILTIFICSSCHSGFPWGNHTPKPRTKRPTQYTSTESYMYAGYKLKPCRISDSTILQVEINNWDFSRDKSKLRSLAIAFYITPVQIAISISFEGKSQYGLSLKWNQIFADQISNLKSVQEKRKEERTNERMVCGTRPYASIKLVGGE